MNNWASEPAANREVYEAFARATGMAVSWSYQRSQDVKDLVARGITPADVTAVIGFIRMKINRGDEGFRETSLMWGNAMRPDVMEDRALLCRQAARRRAGAQPKPPVPHTRTLPDGRKENVLAPPVADRDVPRVDVAKGLQGLIEELKRGGQKR